MDSSNRTIGSPDGQQAQGVRPQRPDARQRVRRRGRLILSNDERAGLHFLRAWRAAIERLYQAHLQAAR